MAKVTINEGYSSQKTIEAWGVILGDSFLTLTDSNSDPVLIVANDKVITVEWKRSEEN